MNGFFPGNSFPVNYWPEGYFADAGGSASVPTEVVNVPQTYEDILKQLLPYGCYSDSADSAHMKDIKVMAGALEACQINADDFTEDEIFPDKVDELLPDWERVYGIASDTSISWASRIDDLLAAVRATGSLTPEYFLSLATRLGYTATIEELEPFMAGWSEAGDTIYVEDIVYVWQLTITNSGVKSYFFEAGVSCAGDSLNYFSEDYLEGIMNKLKPAHTAVVFQYQ